MPDTESNSLTSKSLSDFTDVLSSDSPVPGGGGAAAAIGAIGISLGAMVGALTIGKKKYVDVEDKIKELGDKASTLRLDLLSLVDADAKAFAPLADAYRIPKDNPSRDDIMESALIGACEVPLEIMQKCADALLIIRDYATYGSRLAISDAGCAAVSCRAALLAASLNVSINTRLMKNRDKAAYYDGISEKLLTEYIPIADEIYESIKSQLN